MKLAFSTFALALLLAFSCTPSENDPTPAGVNQALEQESGGQDEGRDFYGTGKRGNGGDSLGRQHGGINPVLPSNERRGGDSLGRQSGGVKAVLPSNERRGGDSLGRQSGGVRIVLPPNERRGGDSI